MTLAWYGHLKFAHWNMFAKVGIFGIAAISWGIAFFEYMAQVPANKIGYIGNGGPFDIWQLKVLQEVITLVVFSIFAMLVFRNEPFKMNHLIGFAFLVLAVYFIFKK
jgi:uncharacterized protein (DUF486 family)